jgi:hypothetical protein
MTALVGRNVRIEVGKTEGTAKTVTAVSKANPGVATATAHGLLDGSVGYFNNVVGMNEVDGLAVRLKDKATDTFKLEGVDTTAFGTFTSGSFVPVTAWATLSRAAGYSVSGGDAEKLDDTCLLDSIKQEFNGLLGAQSVSISLKRETLDEEALQLVEAAAIAGAFMVFRITLADGAQRLWRGQPSMAGEDVQLGGIASGSFSATVSRRILRLPALA